MLHVKERVTMDRKETMEIIIRKLGTIAPEADLDKIEPDVRYRDQFEFDSVDFLNFIASLEKELKISIPEPDYLKLSTINGCLKYLEFFGH